MIGMLKVKVLEVQKGARSLSSFKIILKRNEVKRLKIEENDGLLFKIGNLLFATVLKKQKNSKGSFSYVCTVPRSIAKSMGNYLTLKLLAIDTPNSRKIKQTKYRIPISQFSESYTTHPIYVFDLEDKAIVWIYSRGCKPFVLPTEILVKNDRYSLFEVCGAFFCDGLRARKVGHNLDRLSFANADPQQIQWFVKAVNSLFHTNKKQWVCQILSSDDSSTNIEFLKQFWSKKGFEIKKILVHKNNSVKAPYGVCMASIIGVSFAEIFYQIYEKCKILAVRNRDSALEFFRGVSRGDIGVSNRGGKIHSITFSTEDKKDVEYFKKICTKIRLHTSKPYFSSGCWNAYISGYDNFTKIIKLGGITHAQRKLKLVGGFLRSRKSHLPNYLNAIPRGANTSAKLAKFLNVSQITTRNFLHKYHREGYLKRAYYGKNNSITYTLTKRGEKKLREHKKILG